MKSSPSRERFLPMMKEANEKINDYLKRQTAALYVDVFNLMLDSEGKPQKELFTDDMLHMNKKGYEIWQKAIMPSLIWEVQVENKTN